MAEVTETARPRFYTEPVQNMAKSAEEGRPIFEPKKFIELKHPGDRLYSFVEEIDDAGMGMNRRQMASGEFIGQDYAARFPREWDAFKRGEERASIGTPLDEWPALTRSRVYELKAMNIFTVEELSNIQDGQLQKMGMGARAEREKAKAFLAAAKGSAHESAMAAELAELREMVTRITQGQAQAQIPVPQPVGEQIGEIVTHREKTLEDCTDAELKDFIQRETGERPKGNPSRETLMKRAAELAQAAA